MTETPIVVLLEACRRRLYFPSLGRIANRRLIHRIESWLHTARLSPRFGSAIIAYARSASTALPGITIDPDESETRACESGVEVRAWFLVPSETVAALSLAEPAAEIAFARLEPLARNVLLLRLRYGLEVREIAARLGISHRRASRTLRDAVRAVANSLGQPR
ncbi:sigma factor-like helix-turn-helix DNA-binding protein [Sphingomonas sp. H39-1-10]|uniref:sigma factor-like helix-turn-helix DNA-binding protein n=1 Tax=Sphingomonas pollutisoli TaxID=3030829 RepID=UPI0023B98014|nr:sigma factor-like helix-turn-helix DNA-binding protein [Sphingomonas pollutisoli]MDF0487709.1 sigma factor-like helix-turn-helix DNA-binding protein [Sphingomonas pollutisoli]